MDRTHEDRKRTRTRHVRECIGWRTLKGGLFHRANVQDESGDGIGIEMITDDPPQPADPLRILSQRSSLNRTARVVWVRTGEHGRTRVGCRWTKPR